MDLYTMNLCAMNVYVMDLYTMNLCAMNVYVMNLYTMNMCALDVCALQGQWAHSPGQSEAAPREISIESIRPERAKALIIRYLHFFCIVYILCFCPFRAQWNGMYKSRGAASLCPGLCACSPFRASLLSFKVPCYRSRFPVIVQGSPLSFKVPRYRSRFPVIIQGFPLSL